MAQSFGRRRQIDRYDGQTIFIGNQVAYELGNYLGGGASGSVYQALDVTSRNCPEKSVAIKILKPLGYKILPFGQLSKCIVATKGQPLSQKQIHGKAALTADNLWWLVHPSSEHVYAAYEDASRGQLRELTLPRCIEIWGWAPLGSDQLSPEVMEKRNLSGQSFVVSNSSIVQLPTVAPKYLRWLQSRATICREMNNMIHIGEHPNIVDLLEVLELIQDSKAVLFLVLEFVNGGELFDRMKRSSGPGAPSDEFARRYFSQLLSGIDYCHCKGVVHRDLKPENLLLSDPSESAILKIADFGLSAVVFATEGVDTISTPVTHTVSGTLSSHTNSSSIGGNETIQFEHVTIAGTGMPSENQGHNHVHFNQSHFPIQILQSPVAKQQPHPFSTPPFTPSTVPLRRLRSVVGSPHYIAPEIVNHEDPCGYDGRKVDMWSAGVILYSLLTGSLPFGGDLSSCPRYKLYKQWMLTEYNPAVRDGRGKDVVLPGWFFPPSISPLAGSLILSLIHVDPQQRCTASEALRHPWSLGDGRPSSPEGLSGRSQSQSNSNVVKIIYQDENQQSSKILSIVKSEKDKEKLKLKVQNKEQKEKRSSNLSTPQSLSMAPTTTSSLVNTPRINKPRSPPIPISILPVLQIPSTVSHRSGSPDENSPTRDALASVATALASFSIEVVRQDQSVAVTSTVTGTGSVSCSGSSTSTGSDAIVSCEQSGIRRNRQQQSEETRVPAEVAIIIQSRTDHVSPPITLIDTGSVPITLIDTCLQQPITRRGSHNIPLMSSNINELQSASQCTTSSLIALPSPPKIQVPSIPPTCNYNTPPPPAVHVVPVNGDSIRNIGEGQTNQSVQQAGNTSRYSMIGGHSVGRAQDGQGQGQGQGQSQGQGQDREDRYQSIIEQQRQKEAAALAQDYQSDQSQGQGHGQGQGQATRAVAAAPAVTAINVGNRESRGSIHAIMGTNSVLSSTTTYNENESNVTLTGSSETTQNYRVNVSADAENIVSDTYIVAENNCNSSR